MSMHRVFSTFTRSTFPKCWAPQISYSCSTLYSIFNIYVQEVISPTINHAILGTYKQAKIDKPHVQSYYHATFDVYIIHGWFSNVQVTENMHKAIDTCQPLMEDENCVSIPPKFNDFPQKAAIQRFIHCFVHPMPPSISSPLPLPFLASKLQHGWQVNHSGNISLQRLHRDEWTNPMKEKLLSPSDVVAECINVPHWDQQYLGEFRELNLWHWRSHPSVVLAGLMYPPGTIKFYIPLNTAHVQGRELFLWSLIDKPFGDDINEARHDLFPQR